MSISTLMVDAHGILAQQKFHHLQVFSVGACTERQDMYLSSLHRLNMMQVIETLANIMYFVAI